MGRSSGHLALGIAKAAGATLAVIPEEFDPETVTLDRVCQVLEGSILKRRTMGRNRGLAVVAEGIIEMLRPEELASIPEVEVSYDQHGHIRLGDIPFERILKWKIQQRLAERGENMDIVARNIGYELRSASPIPYDVDYTRTLGYGAVRALLGSRENGLVYLLDGRLGLMPFTELTDDETRRTRIRRVDINSEYYRVARKYMIRLEPEDLASPDMSRRLAESAGVGTEELAQQFAPAA